MQHFSIPLLLLLAVCSMTVALLLIPAIIQLAKAKNLLDNPDERKQHAIPTPTLGGIAIYAGLMLALITESVLSQQIEVVVLGISVTILCLTGVYDDLKDLKASRKFLIQLIVALAIAVSGIRIESLGGLLGWYEIPVWFQYLSTILIIVGVTNAVNLLDGIDGLAGGISLMNALVLAVLFFIEGNVVYLAISIALAGALLGFLYYNFNPAKIFMGDTGSLVIGFTLSVLAIHFLQTAQITTQEYYFGIVQAPFILVFGILILPVFDTLRVFGLRILKGKSPFSADRNHMHHLLIKTGFNHKRSALLMYAANAILIICAVMLPIFQLPLHSSLLLLFVLAILLSELITVKRIAGVNDKIKILGKEKDLLEQQNYLLQRLK